MVTLAFGALYLAYLLNEIFPSTGSHQRPAEQDKHGITPVMIEVYGSEVPPSLRTLVSKACMPLLQGERTLLTTQP